ncbi:hypothetical protein A5N15_00855 [Rothia kristinae]|uniref:Uncharacterized protein n=1 Tax=Rothia kristinae TaxID=37923 RepID=A0A657IX80_9MICC|nr:hypothetical protein A5N15_00855 [Rothia kristinae]
MIYWGVNLLNEDFSQVGVFSDRVGSDALRDRIDDASWAKVQTTGFFGRGLGEAVVHLLDSSGGTEEKAWFFHNSYWSAFVEGGWPWLISIVAVTVLVGVRPFSSISVADPLAGADRPGGGRRAARVRVAPGGGLLHECVGGGARPRDLRRSVGARWRLGTGHVRDQRCTADRREERGPMTPWCR